MDDGLTRLGVRLECECGKVTDGFVVTLKRGGKAPVSCKECGNGFLVEWVVERTTRVQIDVKNRTVSVLRPGVPADDDDGEPTLQ